MNIALLATAWCPRFGGINSFNQDFAIGLASELRDSGDPGRVICAISNATEADIADAKRSNVILIPLEEKIHTDHFDPSWVHEVVELLPRRGVSESVDCWIGHDLVSGSAAVRAPQIAKYGFAALIHHMSYESYKAIEGQNPQQADLKHRDQQQLFRSKKAALFAVGPLLLESCRLLASRDVLPTMLIPGFPKIKHNHSSDSRLHGIVVGRLGSRSDRLKQGRLAISAFGKATKEAAALQTVKLPPLEQPILYVIGLETNDEATEITKMADEYAQEALNVVPLPFDENRQTYLQRLCEANVGFMLSWHEGFGLSGWECIAAEVPLIISKNTGVYKLLDDELHGAGIGCVSPVDVRAKRGNNGEVNFDARSLDEVTKRIIAISNDLPRHKADARELKQSLIRKFKCEWTETAFRFIDGFKTQQRVVTASLSNLAEASTSSARTPLSKLSPQGMCGLTEIHKSFRTFNYDSVLSQEGHLIIVMNDGRSWLRAYRESLWERACVRKQETTIILVHPRSDFIPILMRRNTTKVKSDQISEIRQAETIISELQQSCPFRLTLKGHFLYNPCSMFVTDKIAAVMPYFVTVEGEMPTLVYREGEDSLHSYYWDEAKRLVEKSELIVPGDFNPARRRKRSQ